MGEGEVAMRIFLSILFSQFFISSFGQIVDSLSYKHLEKFAGKVSCQEVEEKRNYLDSVYILLRDEAYAMAQLKTLKDAPCYWYGVRLKTEERFDYKLCDDCFCRLAVSSKSYYAYEFKLYIIRYRHLPLMYPLYSGYTICDQEILRNFPAR